MAQLLSIYLIHTPPTQHGNYIWFHLMHKQHGTVTWSLYDAYTATQHGTSTWYQFDAKTATQYSTVLWYHLMHTTPHSMAQELRTIWFIHCHIAWCSYFVPSWCVHHHTAWHMHLVTIWCIYHDTAWRLHLVPIWCINRHTVLHSLFVPFDGYAVTHHGTDTWSLMMHKPSQSMA